MVNFIHQFDWTTGCPDTWSNIILGLSERMFLDEVNIYIGRLIAVVVLLKWVGPIG